MKLKFVFYEITMLENCKVSKFYLFTITDAKRYGSNKHFMAKAGSKVCKRYFDMFELKQTVCDKVIDYYNQGRGRAFAP